MKIVSPFFGCPICFSPLYLIRNHSKYSFLGNKGRRDGNSRVGGKSGHPENTGESAQREMILILQLLHHAHTRTRCHHEGIFRPVQCTGHHITFFKSCIPRFIYSTDAEGSNWYANLKRLIFCLACQARTNGGCMEQGRSTALYDFIVSSRILPR